MTGLLIVVLSIFAAYLWVNVLPFIWYIKTWLGMPNLKPLDCCVCLATWIATVFTVIYWDNFLNSILTVVCTTFFAYIVERLTMRYL
jgi:hypothetical protein